MEIKPIKVVFGLPFFIFILLILPFIAQASIIDDINSTGNLSSGMVMYYDFNQTGGTALDQWPADVGGNNLPKRINLTARGTGSASILGSGCNGVIGNCANFHSQTGTNWLNFSQPLGVDYTGNAHTVSFWLRHDNTTTDQESYFYTYPATNDWKILYRNSGSGYGTGGDVDVTSPNGNAFPGEWVHWVLTDDGSGSGSAQKLYANGTLRASAGSMTDTLRYVQLCATGSTTKSEMCSASIDEVAIWNLSLSATQIATLYGLYPTSGSAPLLLSPIPNKVLNYSYTDPQTISMDLANHFSGYDNYTLKFTNRTGQYTGLNSVLGNTIEEGVINYTADFYYFTLFFDTDKNISNFQIPIITRNFIQLDDVYEMNLTACNDFGCTSDFFNMTLVATYSQGTPPQKLFRFPHINLTKNGGPFPINITQFVANAYQVNVSAVSGTAEIFNILVGIFCAPLEILDFGFFGFCQTKDFNQYNNYDGTVTLNAENVTKNGNGTINLTLFNENGNITMELNLTVSGVDEPYPIITSPVPDIERNLFSIPTLNYELNMTDHYYNFSQLWIEIINATNSFVNLSNGNYSDNYLNITQLQNSNQTIFTYSHPLSNFTVEVTVHISSINGSASDTFNLIIVNESNIPKPPQVLDIPDIINLSENDNYTMNVSDIFKNYTGFYIEFNNLTGKTETLTDAIAPDSFETPSFNVTVEDNETIIYYSFSLSRFMNLNLTVCNSINCSNATFYLNMSGGSPPTQTQDFSCPSGEAFSDNKNLDFELGLDVDLEYDLNEYFTNFGDIYLTFNDPFTGSFINITQGESYSNESILVTLTSGFIWTAELTNIPEPFFVNVTVCNENGCIKDDLALCVPASTSASFLRGVFMDIINFFASLFPSADDLTVVQQMMYMLFCMVFTAVLLLLLGFFFTRDFMGLVVLLTMFIEFFLFMFFVMIGYVPIVVIILLLLGLLALAWFRFRSSGG